MEAIQEKLGQPLFIHPDAQLCRALGAALFAPGDVTTTGGAGGAVVRTLWVVGAFSRPWGAAPGAPAARQGSPFLPRNGEKEGRGCAPGPRGLWPAHSRSLVLGDRCLWYDQWGCYVRYAKTDLGRIFGENMLKSIFPKESFQIRARTWVTKWPNDRNNAPQSPKRGERAASGP